MESDKHKKAQELNEQMREIERELIFLNHPNKIINITVGIKNTPRSGEIRIYHQSINEILTKVALEKEAKLKELQEEYKAL